MKRRTKENNISALELKAKCFPRYVHKKITAREVRKIKYGLGLYQNPRNVVFSERYH